MPLARLPTKKINEVVNLLSRDCAHHPIPKIRQNMIFQIAEVTVICVWRKAILPRYKRQPLFRKLPIGFVSIVFACYGRSGGGFRFRIGYGLRSFLDGPCPLIIDYRFQYLCEHFVFLEIVNRRFPLYRLQFSRIGFPLLFLLTRLIFIRVNNIVGVASCFICCHNSNFLSMV
ncbi:hypothetical protein SDC9_143022 [bioreactor metagenome]|uniref:Uncharacterized protein n=1 Tax=bioreactor metagenome TaxID=1076179 RepID=A0A645E2S2_9ZZZZ